MKTTQYFLRIGNRHMAKNKLELALFRHFMSYQNFLIADPNAFEKKLKAELARINAEFPRCKDLTASTVVRTSQTQPFLAYIMATRGELLSFAMYPVFGLYAMTKEEANNE